MDRRVPKDAFARRHARARRNNRIVVAASLAVLGAALGGCGVGETNQPLTLVEQKPTGTATGAAGSPGVNEMPAGGAGESGAPVDAWIAFDSGGAIYVIRADGSGRRRLTTGQSTDAEPSFSRDGTKLAFASDRDGGGTQIYVMDLATGVATRVTQRSEGAHDPAFTSDGTRVGYRSGVSVFTVKLDGTDERQVTDGQTCCKDGPFGAPVFLTDGQTTVYDDYNAVYSTTDGMTRQTIVMPTTGEQSHPAVSPDGMSLVLQSTCIDNLDDSAARSLWMVPATGTTSYSCLDGRRLSPHQTDATHGSWGPANMIVWGSVARGTNTSSPVPSSLMIWQDGAVRTLTSGSGDDRNPSWSPTGTVIGNW